MPLMKVNKTVKYKGAEFKPGKEVNVDEKDVRQFTDLGGTVVEEAKDDASKSEDKKPPKK